MVATITIIIKNELNQRVIKKINFASHNILNPNFIDLYTIHKNNSKIQPKEKQTLV